MQPRRLAARRRPPRARRSRSPCWPGCSAWPVGLGPAEVALVVAAVLTGQLSIGWSNDLIDLPAGPGGRPDRQAAGDGRARERLGPGRLRRRGGRHRPAVPARAGWSPARCTWSPSRPAGPTTSGSSRRSGRGLPYAVAFGALPAFVSLADDPAALPPWWLLAAGALLGVGAHLVNVLPDLADDAATGVRGLPHRLGARRSSALAAGVLVGATLVIVVGAPVDPRPVAAPPWCVVGGLAVVALRAHGADAVPGRDRDGPGRRGHAGVGAMTDSISDRAVSARAAVTGTSSSSAPARPGPRPRWARCTPDPGCGCCCSTAPTSRATSPAATASPRTSSTGSSRIGVTGVEDGWTPLTRLELARGDLLGGPADGPAGLRHPARGLRRPAGRAGGRARAPRCVSTGSSTSR